MSNVPTPETVRQSVATVQRYRRQIETARADADRRRNAREHGYRGPLTRRELACKVAR